ncbi:hypothetical protein EXIGLDRAFT_845281 [Exidia glandulosa HHB12029]|uniref:Protein kinase domain-containing protein n=1 Tax=Exidia glandulosa HHB12029 TaxID=1314781 RepID=A0A165BJS6_EXIGL|nr:hypothetical protein EXIGLDRAFT_845281 [Exidia glandulosa HHB12029]
MPLGGRAADVVIKIWQISRMASFEKLKEWVLYTAQSESPYSKMMQGFRVESYWYRYMTPIQGSYVPHVYGFFEIVLPNGEPCIALVTEYIAGTPLLQYVTDRAHTPRLLPLVVLCMRRGNAVASAVHALNMPMVGIRDWHPSNFIVLDPDDRSDNIEIEIVIVDFDQARPLHQSHRTPHYPPESKLPPGGGGI